MQRGTFQLMKSVNKSLVLNKIRTFEPISRAQIAKETKLTPPTVSSIVKELIEEGLVIEKELGASQGGRKPTLLYVNSSAFYVIGVDAGSETIRCILSNLSGEILEQSSAIIQKPITNQAFMTMLKDGIHNVLQASSVEDDKIIGIGVAMHGVVEVETGIALFAPNLELKNIQIKAELEEAFNLNVKVENDGRAMALGESWFGGHANVESMVAVNLGRGVGAGIVINGKLYHGAQDIAGELGHMIIDLHGERCTCGNRGCLQTFATGSAIVAYAHKKIKGASQDADTAETIYERAIAGEQEYIEVFQEIAEIIGIGLTNLIHILNPDKIILGGGVMNSREIMLPVIKQTIHQRALTGKAKETQVEATNLYDNATVLGAISLLLIELFNPV